MCIFTVLFNKKIEYSEMTYFSIPSIIFVIGVHVALYQN